MYARVCENWMSGRFNGGYIRTSFFRTLEEAMSDLEHATGTVAIEDIQTGKWIWLKEAQP